MFSKHSININQQFNCVLENVLTFLFDYESYFWYTDNGMFLFLDEMKTEMIFICKIKGKFN